MLNCWVFFSSLDVTRCAFYITIMLRSCKLGNKMENS